MKWFGILLAMCLALGLRPCVACSDDVQGKHNGEPENQKSLTLDLGAGVTMKLALIPSGKFLMGSKHSAAEVAQMVGGKETQHTGEHPQHEVTISRPFYMGIHEVTQAQWLAVMGTQSWKDKVWGKPGDSNAASWVNWYEASEFCEKLSKRTGKKVTLPTEAQWEYACRAGTKTVYCFGDDPSKLGDYAWYEENTRKMGEEYAHPVGRKKPNPWGLYDMHGNVWEWCRDWYAADFYAKANKVDPENTTKTQNRAVRGGSWYNDPRHSRAAGRNSWTGSNYRHYNYGFRVVVLSAPSED
jgi:formylglycine-generating enzyme required for sulfatase activity